MVREIRLPARSVLQIHTITRESSPKLLSRLTAGQNNHSNRETPKFNIFDLYNEPTAED